MASSSSNSRWSSRSRTVSQNPGNVMCYHREVAPLRVVRFNGVTQGRRFYGCSHWPSTCGFFKWADEVDDVVELQNRCFEKDTMIAELELEKEDMARKIKELKDKKAKVEEERDELAIENNETLIAITSAKADKKLLVALIFSWIFFALVFLMC